MTPTEFKEARHALNWTNAQLGIALGVPMKTVSEWSRGKYRVHPCAIKLITLWMTFPDTRPIFPVHTRPLR